VERNDPLAVARRLFAAIVTGDLDAVRELYAPDVVVWHNTDLAEQSRDENLAVLAWVVRHLDGFRYEQIRLQRTDEGFVQQHVVRGTERASGKELELHAAIVCRVQDGRITRLDEYLDSAAVARVFPALGGEPA
jgi:ketosteroid isomerase-like protein